MNLTERYFVRIILAYLILFSSFSYADFSGFMNSAGDFIKGVGKEVSKATDSVKHEAGIDLSSGELDKNSRDSLAQLYKISPKAQELSKHAKAILVFPEVLKAGMGIGGMYGEGVLYENGMPIGFYSIAGGSYGMQIGAQSYSYAMFFMDDKSLEYLLKHNSGWEVGTGPSIVFADKGMATNATNTSMNQSVYLFTYGQKGLMAGTGIQGSKISKIEPK